MGLFSADPRNAFFADPSKPAGIPLISANSAHNFLLWPKSWGSFITASLSRARMTWSWPLISFSIYARTMLMKYAALFRPIHLLIRAYQANDETYPRLHATMMCWRPGSQPFNNMKNSNKIKQDSAHSRWQSHRYILCVGYVRNHRLSGQSRQLASLTQSNDGQNGW